MRLSFYSGLALAMIAADNARAERARQEAAENHQQQLLSETSNKLIAGDQKYANSSEDWTALAESKSNSAVSSDIEAVATADTGTELDSSLRAGSEADAWTDVDSKSDSDLESESAASEDYYLDLHAQSDIESDVDLDSEAFDHLDDDVPNETILA